MRSILLLAKAPLPGLAKSRLAAGGLDPELVARLARAFLADSLGHCEQSVAEEIVLAFAPAGARELFEALAPRARLLPQVEGELGARLGAASSDAFARGSTRVLALGADTPQLEPAWIDGAFEALERRPLVLGPARDGGYWAIGTRAPLPALFEGIPWSSARVLEATLGRARELGLEVELLPELFDVDTPADLAELAALLARSPERSPATAALLGVRTTSSRSTGAREAPPPSIGRKLS